MLVVDVVDYGLDVKVRIVCESYRLSDVFGSIDVVIAAGRCRRGCDGCNITLMLFLS